MPISTICGAMDEGAKIVSTELNTAMTAYAQREADQRRERVALYDRFAEERDAWRARNRAYYDGIERLARFVVPENASVLEIGCGTGDLLAALRPREGVGLDISPRSIE